MKYSDKKKMASHPRYIQPHQHMNHQTSPQDAKHDHSVSLQSYLIQLTELQAAVALRSVQGNTEFHFNTD